MKQKIEPLSEKEEEIGSLVMNHGDWWFRSSVCSRGEGQGTIMMVMVSCFVREGQIRRRSRWLRWLLTEEIKER